MSDAARSGRGFSSEGGERAVADAVTGAKNACAELACAASPSARVHVFRDDCVRWAVSSTIFCWRVFLDDLRSRAHCGLGERFLQLEPLRWSVLRGEVRV